MVRQEEELVAFAELKASRGTGRKAEYEVRRAVICCCQPCSTRLLLAQKRLKEAGFTSTEDLDEYCTKIEKSLQRARNKDLGIEEEESKVCTRLIPFVSFVGSSCLSLYRNRQHSPSSTSPITP